MCVENCRTRSDLAHELQFSCLYLNKLAKYHFTNETGVWLWMRISFSLYIYLFRLFCKQLYPPWSMAESKKAHKFFAISFARSFWSKMYLFFDTPIKHSLAMCFDYIRIFFLKIVKLFLLFRYYFFNTRCTFRFWVREELTKMKSDLVSFGIWSKHEFL